MANLRAENDRVMEKITDDLDRLADRVAELETRAQRPFGKEPSALPVTRPNWLQEPVAD